MRDLDKDLLIEALLDFKAWCIHDVKYFTTDKRWQECDMKKKLDELGLPE